MENKKVALTVRIDKELKKRLDIMLIHKEKKLQTFLVDCIHRELEEFEQQQKDD
jgi:predicted transcriptional regulator